MSSLPSLSFFKLLHTSISLSLSLSLSVNPLDSFLFLFTGYTPTKEATNTREAATKEGEASKEGEGKAAAPKTAATEAARRIREDEEEDVPQQKRSGRSRVESVSPSSPKGSMVLPKAKSLPTSPSCALSPTPSISSLSLLSIPSHIHFFSSPPFKGEKEVPDAICLNDVNQVSQSEGKGFEGSG
ncbi:unnamed protein product [Acanthosepion pharaonis]|uniref:Uncharacterized protein n=1 Tax=Acanthosepion pharaonis TaxID=158019 RepID=A0A812AQL1_ACAPH|nr:unnamed protein product [Sepia pharaonis]